MPSFASDEKNSNSPLNGFPPLELATTQTRFVAALAFAGFLASTLFFADGRAYREPKSPPPFVSKTEIERANAARSLDEVVASLAPTKRERRIVETSVKIAPISDGETAVEPFVFLVDLNSAKKSELLNLPRIGDQLADRILEYRDANGGFRSVDELREVKGIGEKTLARLRPLCVAGPLPETETAEPSADRRRSDATFNSFNDGVSDD